MINTISYDEAVKLHPAIKATTPSERVSKKYSFISTDQIIQKALENDWLIHKVNGSKSLHGVHSVNLIHKSQLKVSIEEGFPQISIINSHNRSRKFSCAIGFFRLICSNGLIAPTGLVQSISPSLHRPGFLPNGDQVVSTLENAFNQFSKLTESIDKMKERILSEEESRFLARFAYYLRFRYRMVQPKKVDPFTLLKPRRETDNRPDLWTTFNVIQENITLGGNGIGRGISRFEDDLRFNQELWTGVDKAINTKNAELELTLKSLFPKKKRNGGEIEQYN